MHDFGKGATILVVDDQEMVVKLCARILDQAGFSVLSACDGDAALDICRESRESIAVALLDVVMPKMQGPELASRIIELHPEVSPVFMSGYEGYRVERYLPFSFKWFLRKPFKPEDLLDIIQKPLEEVKKLGPYREKKITYIRKASGG